MIKNDYKHAIEVFKSACDNELSIYKKLVNSYDSVEKVSAQTLLNVKILSLKQFQESKELLKSFLDDDGDPRLLLNQKLEGEITSQDVNEIYLQASESRNSVLSQSIKVKKLGKSKEALIGLRELVEMRQKFDWHYDCAFAAKAFYLKNCGDETRLIGGDYSLIEKDDYYQYAINLLSFI